MFFVTLVTLAATVMNGCAPSPTPIATSEIATPTAEQLDALHTSMFLIQVDAEFLGEAALRVQSGDLDDAGLGGVFTAIARYAGTIDQVASGIPVPEGLSPAWDEAFEAHVETRAILSRWSNAEIDPEQVIAQVEPVRQSAAHAQQVAELWMMQLVGGDTAGLAAARAKQLARMVDQVFAPTPTPEPTSEGVSTAEPGTNLAYRKPVNVSRALGDFPAAMAVDGFRDNVWNSGAFAPQWIVVDLGANYVIVEVRLLTAQSPAGETIHRLLVKGPVTSNEYALLHTFQGVTADSTWLTFKLPEPLQGIRYIRVETTSSPSWVGWREIEVIAAE